MLTVDFSRTRGKAGITKYSTNTTYVQVVESTCYPPIQTDYAHISLITKYSFPQIQINISPREDDENSARSGAVRGLSGVGTRVAPPESSRDPAISDLLDNRASAAGDRSEIGNGSPAADKSNLTDRRSGARDLCLSMAVGISPAQLVAFVASFREVSPVADLVMFFESPTNERFNDIIEKCVAPCVHSAIGMAPPLSELAGSFFHHRNGTRARGLGIHECMGGESPLKFVYFVSGTHTVKYIVVANCDAHLFVAVTWTHASFVSSWSETTCSHNEYLNNFEYRSAQVTKRNQPVYK